MKPNLKYPVLAMFCLLILQSGGVLCASDSLASKDRRQVMSVKNSEGTEFWLCFMRNFQEEDKPNPSNKLMLELFITGSFDTKVSVAIDGLGYKLDTFLIGGSVYNIKISPKAEDKSDEQAVRLAVHITSDKPISVYGLNRRYQTTDTYLGLPVSVLGTEYRAMCYNVANKLMSEFAIVATEDSTEVTIIPTASTMRSEKGEPYTVGLRRGDVYQVSARFEALGRCDLTGTLIKSNKKIAVFSGHQCAYVPQYIIACNHLVEQCPPIPSWGKHFYIGKLESRSFYTYRVLANEPRTKVFEDSRLVKTLNGGDYYEGKSEKAIQITADKPVLVAQYSQGFQNGDSIGDPMMLFISPTQQFLNQYRFATPVNGSWKHYVNVVVPDKAISTMRLDNEPIDTSLFHPLGISRYSIAYIQVPFGTHTIEGDLPFGMSSYGFGYALDGYDAYGTMGGQSFHDYEPASDTLSPICEINKAKPGTGIILRDDREDDTGIKKVKVLESSGVDVSVPKFEEGLLQLPVEINLKSSAGFGRTVLQVEDVALNSAVYTICSRYEPKTKSGIMSISEGKTTDCVPNPGFQLGIFFKLSSFFHSADFSNTGNLTSNGKFSNATGFGGIGGIMLERQISPNLVASARLSFESYGGTLSAPGAIDSIRDQITGKLVASQEEKLLSLNGLYMHITPAAEWFFSNYIYLLGGLNFAINLSSAVTVQEHILMPESFVYADGSKTMTVAPGNLSSLSAFRFGIMFGGGVNYPIDFNFSVFGEASYTLHFGNLINDGNWGLQQLSFQFGLKYNL
jgi:hypothetical protein